MIIPTLERILLIEVADSSLLLDRRVKIPLYAQAGVDEVWLVDLTVDRVEVYRGGKGSRYRERSLIERGQRMTPGAFSELALTVEDLIG